MFGGTGAAGSSFSFTSPPGGGFSSPQHQQSMTGLGSAIMSPSTSGLGVGLKPVAGGGGSPVFQSPSGNKFPVGGGEIIFTPYSNTSPIGGTPSATAVSPYSFVGGSASSFVQSPPQVIGNPAGMMYSPPPYSSTMQNAPVHQQIAASPIMHGYVPQTQYTHIQPYGYGYGTRTMTGQSYHQSPYQHFHGSPYTTHHSPRDEASEPMHCSPVGQPHPAGSPHYQQVHRSPGNNPPRPHHLPSFLTGVDVVASVPPRPRRVFDRSPSTSPPVNAGSGGRSPQSKSPNWTQQEGSHSVGPVYSGQGHGHIEGGSANAFSSGFTKRAQGQGPARQLRFNESQNLQNSEEKEKMKRNGPPIHGFGTSEDVANFLNSPLLNENHEIVPGAAIAQEAISKAGYSTPKAESNWVTVFGFPAAAASFIYTHFAQYGSILQSKCNPGGNWLHIQYSSVIDARRALACNGKVLGGSIMVGVISSPKEVIEMYDKPLRESKSDPGPSSSANPPSQQLHSSFKAPLQERNSDSFNTTEGSNKVRSIRPLAGSSQLTSPVIGAQDRSSYGLNSSSKDKVSVVSPSASQNENVPLPTASTGILTKAMEYMFGW